MIEQLRGSFIFLNSCALQVWLILINIDLTGFVSQSRKFNGSSI